MGRQSTVWKSRIALLATLIIIAISGTIGAYYLSQPTNTARIVISGVLVNVDLAKTPAEWEKGLSGRTSMTADHGMLFIFNTEDYWAFWMQGMRFPLDIIWFNSGKHVVFIEQNLQPCSPQVCPAFIPTAKALYVLEVNAGFVRAHNVVLGSTFSFS